MNKFLLPGVLVTSALVLGIFFKYGTKSIDSPMEQVVEIVLKQHGIDVDFSDDKKTSQNKEIDDFE